jgi:hypothetical protein
MKDHGAHEEVDKEVSTLKTADGIVGRTRFTAQGLYTMPSDFRRGFLLNSSMPLGNLVHDIPIFVVQIMYWFGQFENISSWYLPIAVSIYTYQIYT